MVEKQVKSNLYISSLYYEIKTGKILPYRINSNTPERFYNSITGIAFVLCFNRQKWTISLASDHDLLLLTYHAMVKIALSVSMELSFIFIRISRVQAGPEF